MHNTRSILAKQTTTQGNAHHSQPPTKLTVHTHTHTPHTHTHTHTHTTHTHTSTRHTHA